MQNFTAYWNIFTSIEELEKCEDDKAKPVLKNIDFHAKKGEHIAIIGKVGSGKSSFLSSFLYEIPTY